MKENVLLIKSFDFAVRVVETSRILASLNKEFVLSKQLLRSGTSIGANVEEANACHSKKEFASKLQICLKEARETHYWLRLLLKVNLLEPSQGISMLSDLEEILRIINAILISTQKSLEAEKFLCPLV